MLSTSTLLTSFSPLSKAGLEIIAALPKLNRELEAKGLRLSKPLRIRLGMHSGSVVIGAMGGGNRTETVRSEVLLLLLIICFCFCFCC